MKFEINSSPHLEMSDITKQLFNRNFHSDVQFIVQDKIIYAHSLELIKRSIVFEQQLEDTMGGKKLIRIYDFKYESFFEFIRFIYTDECEFNSDNYIEILILATKYLVIKLENRVINSECFAGDWISNSFNYCICDKYELARNMVKQFLAGCCLIYLLDDHLMSLQEDAIEELLKFESIEEGVTELQLFTVVAKWIELQCITHKITLPEGRQRWDKLIKQIRFPTMTIEELRAGYTKYPGLLNESDCMSIARQTICSPCGGGNDLWISKGREIFIWPIADRYFKQGEDFKTIFSVCEDTILHGLRFGVEHQKKPIQIEILEIDNKTNNSEKLSFSPDDPDWNDEIIISLGQSLRFKPNCIYTISITFLEIKGVVCVVCRDEITEVIINDPGETVNLIQASPNMFEMFFKPATN